MSITHLTEDEPVEVTVPSNGTVLLRLPPLVSPLGNGGPASRTIKVSSDDSYQDFTERGLQPAPHELGLPLIDRASKTVRITLCPIDRIWLK